METLSNYIDGKQVPPVRGQYGEVIEPATGAPYARFPASTKEDVDAAVSAGQRAFPAWRKKSGSERARILEKFADLVDEKFELFAQAETRDTGKPIQVSKSLDIPRVSSNFRFFASAIRQFEEKSFIDDSKTWSFTRHEALGVVACISPWNLPLYLLSWKIAPALAMGNCVVAKPSEVTPVTASLLVTLAEKAGIPPGVLNLVHGRGPEVGPALIEHPDIRAVSFTGGTKTGMEISSRCAPLLKKVSLELGGKNPMLIFGDCDFEKMLSTTLRSSFLNQGQICLAGSRILVEDSLYSKFKENFVKAVQNLRCGDPAEESTEQGALVSEAHCEKVMAAIAKAKSDGARILCGGQRLKMKGRCENGYFVGPTVLEGLGEDFACNQEEIFGPVVSLQSFKTEAEAIRLANGTRYGLAASLWTQSVDRAQRVSAELESGIVWLNCWLKRDLRVPFGGVKQSGLGREGGMEALRFFSEPKSLTWEWTENAQ